MVQKLDSENTCVLQSSGSVRCLISPNRLHHLYLSERKSAHPCARLYAFPGLRATRKDLASVTRLRKRGSPRSAKLRYAGAF
jgi:hypothetical protein